jgi:hypothetical protein
MITDEIGEELTYWPVEAMAPGDTSEVLTFSVPVEDVGFLQATEDSRVKLWVRQKGVGATYQDITVDPIDLGPIPTGDTEFEGYVEAVGPVIGLERIPITVTAGLGHPAGWTE